MQLAFDSATRQRLVDAFRCGLAGLLFLATPLLWATAGHAQTVVPCDGTDQNPGKAPRPSQGIGVTDVPMADNVPDLLVTGTCVVEPGGDYFFGKVNVIWTGKNNQGKPIPSKLIFKEGTSNDNDKVTNFWARSIIVENNGQLLAGDVKNPYGTQLHTLNIILYGKDRSNNDPINTHGQGDLCATPYADHPDPQRKDKTRGHCGVPINMWTDNGKTAYPPCKEQSPNLIECIPGLSKDQTGKETRNLTDFFYQYGAVYGAEAPTPVTWRDPNQKPPQPVTVQVIGHYGYKVLAVSYGGTLQLYGKKGTAGAAAADADPTKPGTSWVRLAGGEQAGADLQPGGKKLMVDRAVEGDWQAGDRIVVTTTDYLPSHSEELTIDTVTGNTITTREAAKWPHVGKTYDLKALDNAGTGFKQSFADAGLSVPKSAETRAVVALLTRSIRIVSGGDFAGDYFDCYQKVKDGPWFAPRELSHNNQEISLPTTANCATARDAKYSFGGHTQFRQGFAKLQLQGVEFHQMGQGGRKAHYPVHLHLARQVPGDTYIKDSSVSESMTRWYVLHSTLGVTLQRNVGWKSIGHGYYLESATEADNKFYANIGIYARGGVQGPQNPRNIPGILAENGRDAAFTYRSDVVYPTVFWIPNGWNEFVGNMAAGAGACGVGFWYVPAGNTDHVEVSSGNMKHMKWKGYAGRQTAGYEGDTPVKLFSKNYSSTMMHSLNTSDGVSNCDGVRFFDEGNDLRLAPVRSIAPGPLPTDPNSPDYKKVKMQMEMYYPKLASNRNPTVCDPSLGNDAKNTCTGPWVEASGSNDNGAANVVKRCNNTDPKNCGITLIDGYTSSFHWAQTNFSAVWLRTPGWLMIDNSFISDVQNGGLTFVSGGDYSRSSNALGYWALASHSIFVGATNKDAANKFAAASGPSPVGQNSPTPDQNVCDIGRGNTCISFKDSVAYPTTSWGTGQRMFNIYDGPAHQNANAYLNIKVSDCDDNKKCMYFGTPGIRKYQDGDKKGQGYLPNAAIGWKQPNGFYYPPAFHSKNLYFDGVGIRHYVILPIFEFGSYRTDNAEVQKQFKGGVEGAVDTMRNFTDVDRQTELNDDDGTLTGFTNTISVNEDGFFGAPIQTAQCKSNFGVTPSVACKPPPKPQPSDLSPTPATARTSPYDYVTTVIYPACATKVEGVGDKPFKEEYKDDLRPYGACLSATKDIVDAGRFTQNQWRGGTWSRDCTAPFCFGVPIYRQYLTGVQGGDAASSTREWKTWFQNGCGTKQTDMTNDKGDIKDECNFPFARMAGVNAWQRSVMTVNNGKFYIDTTRSKDFQRKSEALGKKGNNTQDYVECKIGGDKDTDNVRASGNCQQRSVNVFEENKTYFMFFVFAKKSTKQKYQFYVGPGFTNDTVKEACACASGDAICGGDGCGGVVEQRTNRSRRVTRRDRFSPLVDRVSTSLCR